MSTPGSAPSGPAATPAPPIRPSDGPAHAAAPPDQAPGGDLAGLRVIVCRAEDDAGPVVGELQALGAEPVLVPLVQRAAPADGGAALRAAIDRLARYHWIAATSAAGVNALVEALAGRSLPSGLQVAAVGPATAAAFTAAGLPVHLIPATATAADLAAAFPTVAPTGSVAPAGESGPPAGVQALAGPVRVLAPLAEAASRDLEDGLRARGYTVDRVDAYRLADPPGTALPGGGADAVLLTAPSVVDRFLDRFGPAAVPPIVVCIGPRTAERARERGLSGLTVATEHSEAGLLAALIAATAPHR